MIKKRIYGNEAREALLSAAKELFTPVACTLGPKGKTVMISGVMDSGRITKDGVSVAREVESEDPFINAGIKVFRQGASKTVEDAGDGTTTATVLACTLIKEIDKDLKAGANILDIKENLQVHLQSCISALKCHATPLIQDEVLDITKLQHIATTSANNDEFIGELLASAYEELGANTIITLKKTKDKTRIEKSTGMKLERGYASDYFANVEGTNLCSYTKPLVFITDKNITKLADIVKVVEYSMAAKLPLIIFCADIGGEALGTLNNNISNGLQVCAITFPAYIRMNRAILRDIAVYTGAKFVTEELGYNMDNITQEQVPELLGTASKFESGPENCVIVGGMGDIEEIKKRSIEISKEITSEIAESDKEELLARKSKLNGGIAILHIGGKTDPETGEALDRAEDAILAVRSALEEGYLPGCGKSYLMASILLPEGILKRVLPCITKQICLNADIPPEPIILEMLQSDKNTGYNAKTGVTEDLCVAGVIDSAKVARVALENAVSIALAFLNTDCLIAQFKEEDVKEYEVRAAEVKRNKIEDEARCKEIEWRKRKMLEQIRPNMCPPQPPAPVKLSFGKRLFKRLAFSF